VWRIATSTCHFELEVANRSSLIEKLTLTLAIQDICIPLLHVLSSFHGEDAREKYTAQVARQ
jgi:hypothetical protein